MKNYEEQLKRLEDIVSSLEKNDLKLEEATRLYEEGIKLSTKLLKFIEETEGKISRSGEEEMKMNEGVSH